MQRSSNTFPLAASACCTLLSGKVLYPPYFLLIKDYTHLDLRILDISHVYLRGTYCYFYLSLFSRQCSLFQHLNYGISTAVIVICSLPMLCLIMIPHFMEIGLVRIRGC